MIGETFGSYRAESLLGEGGMGRVFVARHTLIGKRAAVKVLLPEYSANPAIVQRFFEEARITAEHVGRAVLYFATRQTPTTGATIPVDGGSKL